MDESTTASKASCGRTEHLLETLSPSMFPNRAAVRAFVAGPGFTAAMDAIRVLLEPPDDVPAWLWSDASDGACFLAQDLGALAQVAAAGDDEAFELCGNGSAPEGHRADFYALGTVAALKGLRSAPALLELVGQQLALSRELALSGGRAA